MKKNVCSGYAIDFTNNTFTMNYTFAKASKIVGSAEYRTVKRALEDFPNLTVITKAGREITTPRKTNRLTYANMRAYISVQESGEAYLRVLDRVITESKVSKSPYKYVRDWFEKQFPDYRTATLFATEENTKADHSNVVLKTA